MYFTKLQLIYDDKPFFTIFLCDSRRSFLNFVRFENYNILSLTFSETTKSLEIPNNKFGKMKNISRLEKFKNYRKFPKF